MDQGCRAAYGAQSEIYGIVQQASGLWCPTHSACVVDCLVYT